MANHMICFGYKMTNGTLCVAEEEAAVVTEIFQRYLNKYQLGLVNINRQDFSAKILALCENEINKPRKNIEIQKSIEEKYNWLKNYILNTPLRSEPLQSVFNGVFFINP